jgi:hypothetical protein
MSTCATRKFSKRQFQKTFRRNESQQRASGAPVRPPVKTKAVSLEVNLVCVLKTGAELRLRINREVLNEMVEKFAVQYVEKWNLLNDSKADSDDLSSRCGEMNRYGQLVSPHNSASRILLSVDVPLEVDTGNFEYVDDECRYDHDRLDGVPSVYRHATYQLWAYVDDNRTFTCKLLQLQKNNDSSNCDKKTSNCDKKTRRNARGKRKPSAHNMYAGDARTLGTTLVDFVGTNAFSTAVIGEIETLRGLRFVSLKFARRIASKFSPVFMAEKLVDMGKGKLLRSCLTEQNVLQAPSGGCACLEYVQLHDPGERAVEQEVEACFPNMLHFQRTQQSNSNGGNGEEDKNSGDDFEVVNATYDPSTDTLFKTPSAHQGKILFSSGTELWELPHDGFLPRLALYDRLLARKLYSIKGMATCIQAVRYENVDSLHFALSAAPSSLGSPSSVSAPREERSDVWSRVPYHVFTEHGNNLLVRTDPKDLTDVQCNDVQDCFLRRDAGLKCVAHPQDGVEENAVQNAVSSKRTHMWWDRNVSVVAHRTPFAHCMHVYYNSAEETRVSNPSSAKTYSDSGTAQNFGIRVASFCRTTGNNVAQTTDTASPLPTTCASTYSCKLLEADQLAAKCSLPDYGTSGWKFASYGPQRVERWVTKHWQQGSLYQRAILELFLYTHTMALEQHRLFAQSWLRRWKMAYLQNVKRCRENDIDHCNNTGSSPNEMCEKEYLYYLLFVCKLERHVRPPLFYVSDSFTLLVQDLWLMGG